MATRTGWTGPRPGSARGFTLIELLVVIAIIAILASIVMPVYSKAREKAVSVSCLSNIKQIGTAATMYAHDWDLKFPSGLYLTGVGESWWRWPDMLQPYVQNYQLFFCPDSVEIQDTIIWGQYAYNAEWVLVQHTQARVPMHLKITNTKRPSEQILFTETIELPTVDGYPAGAPYLEPGSTTNQEIFDMLTDRHMGGCNNVFVDSHAKWISKQQLMSNPTMLHQDWFQIADVWD
ncbi:MAG TPA: prepilin-type N-terminal cleavage/methylation domain-containing protein [Armatimonadota bacterium]|nr:prepilin-type N-terminal cleavage/methylation domain-containing protein [Armatimonadota bacterium]